jgi:hypothetical protein
MPDIHLYQSALQHPAQCFTDEELKSAKVIQNAAGWMPLAWAGQFAVVFKMQTASGFKAVRCFYHPRTEHEDRYCLFHEYIKDAPVGSLIQFEYQPEGIHLNGDSYPIVKMEWVEGETLDRQVKMLVERRDTAGLGKLSNSWRDTAFGLRKASIAHGDLQHANILSKNGTMRLVDYDGVYIPSFQGKAALETGHRNYQHPRRAQSGLFGLDIDHFSSLVIYLTLRALAVDPRLWDTFHQDDYLILKQDDYASPHKSAVLKALKRSSDTQVRELAGKLEALCTMKVEDVPAFDRLVPSPEAAPPVKTRPDDIPVTTRPEPSAGQMWWNNVPVTGTTVKPENMTVENNPIPQTPSPTQHPRQGRLSEKQVALILVLIMIAICLLSYAAGSFR